MTDKNKDTKEKVVTDWLGRPIAVEKKDHNGKTTVTSWTGKPKGSADDKGTRDWLGRPIANGNHPDLLAGNDDE